MSYQARVLQRGFNLIELIIVIVVAGVIAVTLASFIKPALDSFVDVRSRADMADQGDTALRRMLRDVRRAVPNSLRVPTSQCFEVVPLVSGGRYRMGPDATADTAAGCPTQQPLPPTAPSASCSAWVDTAQATMAFDTLSPMSTDPLVGDFVVINNQNGNDVYTGANRSAVTAVAATGATQGYKRITMNSMQVSPGYTGGRFQTVSSKEQSVFYVCSGTGSSGKDGTGTVYRLVRTFTSAYPAACPSTAGAAPLATNVLSCSFVYTANQGSTQQSGYMWMTIEMMRNGETSKLVVGAHVMNVP